MMFDDLANLLADDVICIAVGAIARELAPHLLQGTNIKLLNKNIPIQHPSRSKNGWMTTPERDRNVKVACKIAEKICGGEHIVFKNIKDIKMIQPVSGPVQCMELMRSAREEEKCARRARRKEDRARVDEGIKRREEDCAREEEKCAREVEERVRKQKEEQARKEKESMRWKELAQKFEEEKEERAKRLQQWMKKEEEEKCARKEEGMNSDSPQDNRKSQVNA